MSKFVNECSNCKKDFETISEFRSICPECSEKSYFEAGVIE